MISRNPAPRRGEIWTAQLGSPPRRHWVVVVSLDERNLSERTESVLVVPFGSRGAEGPTTMGFEPGETGLPGPSFLKGHFITTLNKASLNERLPRPLSATRMKQISLLIRRAFDPETPWQS